jgi:hypothetical protein
MASAAAIRDKSSKFPPAAEPISQSNLLRAFGFKQPQQLQDLKWLLIGVEATSFDYLKHKVLEVAEPVTFPTVASRLPTANLSFQAIHRFGRKNCLADLSYQSHRQRTLELRRPVTGLVEDPAKVCIDTVDTVVESVG